MIKLAMHSKFAQLLIVLLSNHFIHFQETFSSRSRLLTVQLFFRKIVEI